MHITAIELKVLPNLVVVTVKTDCDIGGHGFAQKGLSVAFDGNYTPPFTA